MPNYNDDPNMVPLMRMSPYGGYQKPVSKYSKPNNGMPRMEDLSGDGKITQKDVLIGRGVIDAPTKRTGVGTKSIKQRIKEDGKKQKQKEFEETQLNANSSNPDSYGATITRNIKKSPTKRFCGGTSKPYKRKK